MITFKDWVEFEMDRLEFALSSPHLYKVLRADLLRKSKKLHKAATGRR